MGSPPMNLVPATFAEGKVTFSGQTGRLAAMHPNLAPEVVVGIRPEAFLPASGAGMLSLRATSVENAGSDTFVEFELGGKEITARLPGRMRIAAGDRVPLDVDLATVSYFDPTTEQRIG
jgi:ABC-type sugar transport system ATPase subunit